VVIYLILATLQFKYFHIVHQLNALTTYIYMTSQSLHSGMFWHYIANFRQNLPSLKTFIVKWITTMKFITFNEFCM